MKVHAYLLCFNEEDIIQSVLDYYNTFCSKIFIFDNLSTDNSLAIASKYENVKVISFDSGGVLDDKLHVKIKTEAYKQYSRKGGAYTEEVADWIVCADMDELIYHPDIINVLSEYKNLGITVPQITGFNMIGREDINTQKPIIEQYRLGVREPVFDKRAIFDVDFDMAYSPGCHSERAGFEYMKGLYNYKTSNIYPIALLHYKHIGKRLLNASLKNYKRYSPDGIKINSDGRYVGPGSHYKFYVDKAFKESPFTNKAKNIFDEYGYVLFDEFPPLISENLSKRLNLANPAGAMSISGKDFDFLQGLATKVEKLDFDSAEYIVDLLLRFRPESEFLNLKKKYYIKTKNKE
jgi:hypothetical protein